jgi:cysteine desulfurase
VQKDGLISLDDLRRDQRQDDPHHDLTASNESASSGRSPDWRDREGEGILFHTDAVRAVGKVPFNVNELKVDMASMSAHKMYGPKGVGALYVRRRNPRVLLAPIIDGGGHERGMRSGTLNVPGIVGFGKAAELCRLDMEADTKRLLALRERLNERLHKGLDEIYINGSMQRRLPHNLNISFAYVEGESLLMGINDVAVSSGSACTRRLERPPYWRSARRRHLSTRRSVRPRPLDDEERGRLRGGPLVTVVTRRARCLRCTAGEGRRRPVDDAVECADACHAGPEGLHYAMVRTFAIV